MNLKDNREGFTMIPITYPQVANVEVVATQSQPADTEKIAFLKTTNAALNDVTYIVKVNLSAPLPVTSAGFTLYVGDYQVRKYSAFPGGIYFKVYDPNFFVDHGGEPLKFSVLGMAAQETGSRLPTLPGADAAATRGLQQSSELPTQEQILRLGN
jgi:hypothetical protein